MPAFSIEVRYECEANCKIGESDFSGNINLTSTLESAATCKAFIRLSVGRKYGVCMYICCLAFEMAFRNESEIPFHSPIGPLVRIWMFMFPVRGTGGK